MGNALLLEPLAMPSITASNTASGYSAGNVGNDFMGLVWKSDAGAAARNIVIDLGADKPVDTIALFGLFGAQPGWQLSVDLATSAQGAFGGSFTSGPTESLLAGSAMPVSELGRALYRFVSPPPVSRYVRLNFSSLGSAAVQVSRAVICSAIQLDRNYQFGAAYGVRPLGTVDFSARGVLLRRRGKKLRGVGITFGSIYKDEVEEKVQPLLERIGNDEPLCIVTDPDADAQRQNRMWLGFLTGNLGTVHARPGGFRADFNLVAID